MEDKYIYIYIGNCSSEIIKIIYFLHSARCWDNMIALICISLLFFTKQYKKFLHATILLDDARLHFTQYVWVRQVMALLVVVVRCQIRDQKDNWARKFWQTNSLFPFGVVILVFTILSNITFRLLLHTMVSPVH